MAGARRRSAFPDLSHQAAFPGQSRHSRDTTAGPRPETCSSPSTRAPGPGNRAAHHRLRYPYAFGTRNVRLMLGLGDRKCCMSELFDTVDALIASRSPLPPPGGTQAAAPGARADAGRGGSRTAGAARDGQRLGGRQERAAAAGARRIRPHAQGSSPSSAPQALRCPLRTRRSPRRLPLRPLLRHRQVNRPKPAPHPQARLRSPRTPHCPPLPLYRARRCRPGRRRGARPRRRPSP